MFLSFQRVIGHVQAVAVTELISVSFISACHRACSGCSSYRADKCFFHFSVSSGMFRL